MKERNSKSCCVFLYSMIEFFCQLSGPIAFEEKDILKAAALYYFNQRGYLLQSNIQL